MSPSDTLTPMKIESFGMTDVGKRREKNEDSYLINTTSGLYVIADGMGGHLGGEYASKMAVTTIEDIMSELMSDPDATLSSNIEIRSGDYKGYLKYAIGIASNRIFERALRDPSLHGMGTTATSLLFAGEKAYIANVGDSRCYLIRRNKITQITTDHSLVSEQLKAGIISVSDAKNHKLKNIITRSVGFQEDVEADVSMRTPKKGDKFMLCTDGLSNMVSTEEILEIVSSEEPREACYQLISLANEHGGDDNITVVISRIVSAGEVAEDDEETLARDAGGLTPGVSKSNSVRLDNSPATWIDCLHESTKPGDEGAHLGAVKLK